MRRWTLDIGHWTFRPGHWTFSAVLVLLTAAAGHALVARIYPLGQVIESSDWIASGPATWVEGKPGRLALRGKALKGKIVASPLMLDMAGSAGKPLGDRARAGQRFVLFGSVTRGGVLFGFTEGTWFRAKRAGATWTVASTNPDMTRTWTGTSAGLEKLVTDVLAGRTPAPAPDPKAKPTLGPLVRKQ